MAAFLCVVNEGIYKNLILSKRTNLLFFYFNTQSTEY